MAELVEGVPEGDIKTGEKYAESPVTGERYRVTRWVDKGDGKITALDKEPWPECRHPGCDEIQEFPTGPDEFCISHSLGMYFFWRPLAEFSLGEEVGGASE